MPMTKHWQRAQSKLRPSLLRDYVQRDVDYLHSLHDDNLLLYYRVEAGLYNNTQKVADSIHWGWDGPFSHIHGQFTGHFISAAARIWALYGDAVLKARVDKLVSEIAHCQREHGNGWAFPIPENHLHWLTRGKRTWAPQYVCHKVMMGLFDAYRYAGNEQALDVLRGCADWFYDFTASISRETMDHMMDIEETGGIQELWADLYAVTGEEKHRALIGRYDRPKLYEPLLRGKDPLTNQHANTTMGEMQGAARAYEVTGDERYRKIVEAYWKCAITDRGTFVTGNTTSGEIYQPKGMQAARLGDKNQEHCCVHNMMRIAEYLYRWTGEAEYADFYEKNVYNGLLAQGHYRSMKVVHDRSISPPEGRVAYYLPLAAGSRKIWGSDTDHFWCCHCTLVQSATILQDNSLYVQGDTVTLAQYFPMEGEAALPCGTLVPFTLEEDRRTDEGLAIVSSQWEHPSRPAERHYVLTVGADATFTLRLRAPGWSKAPVCVYINDVEAECTLSQGHLSLRRGWQAGDRVRIVLAQGLAAWPLPDRPETVAFLYGPVALCAMVPEERTLYGDIDNPATFLHPDNEREWGHWSSTFRTVGQPVNFSFVPLYEIGHETYTVYFPVQPADVRK